jgi:uncharacterized protein (TIGR02246 family)
VFAQSKILSVFLLSITVIGISACSLLNAPEDNSLTPSDISQIRDITNAYIAAWIAGDADAVMALFTDDPVIIPNQRNPIEGDAAIRAYWWPDDGTTTTITRYVIDLDEINGSGDIAYTRGHAELAFTYEADGTSSNFVSRSVSMSVLKKQADGSWKIARRMWTSLPNP